MKTWALCFSDSSINRNLPSNIEKPTDRITDSPQTMTILPSHSEAMDIYNDVFIAIYNNLQKSRIAPDTNWEAYMLKIGKNMVDKIYRAPKDGRIVSLDFDSLFDETPDDTQSRSDRLMDQISSIENTDNPYEDPILS